MSDMPDFDSMTPEELMKWMESLAVRQGATEGLTTSADMQVAEVAEDDERLAGKGDYVPYGWTEDKWKEHLAKEEEQKKAKGAAAPAASAPTPPPAPAPAPEPVAQAPQAAAESTGTPDFDSMSPEELMKWMESLAVRQGATEGLITSADMAVEEVSADDERLAGKGDYVPYGWTEDKWKEHLAKEEEQKKAKGAVPAAPKAVAPAPMPEPEAEPEPEMSFEMPDFGIPEDTSANEPIAENPMDWLASLGAPDEALPSLNLDALGDLAGVDEGAGDPMAWLSGLSDDSGSDALASLSALANNEPSPAEEGSLEWIESLAARQGADSDELVTDAKLNIPSPLDLQETGPGYAEFSFENATGILPEAEKMGLGDMPELELEDPEAWLDNLASGGNLIGGEEDDLSFLDGEAEELDFDFSAEAVEEEEPSHNFDEIAVDVKAKLDKGIASPEEIEQFFMHAFTKAGERTDVEDYVDSDDDDEEMDVPMPVQAEIPDWLRDSMETIEAVEEETVTAPRPSETGEMMAAKLFDDAEAVPADIPDWLSGGSSEDTGAIDVDIFASPEEEPSPAVSAFALETQDTWVEAFSQEESGALAQWYQNAVAGLDDGEVAAPMGAAVTLAAANLPDESSLAVGSPMRVPDWLSGEVSATEGSVEVEAAVVNDMDWLTTEESAAVDAEMPDWLRDTVDDTVTAEDALPEWLQGENLDIAPADIPDWLRETVEEEEVAGIPELLQLQPEPTAPTPPPAPKPVTMPVPVKASPAPVPVAAANIDVAATLQAAQSKIAASDIDGALLDFEQVVRANASLPQVETALQKLADDKNHKGNPAIYRVLGDVMMRQGKLQQALDTYRKALNLL